VYSLQANSKNDISTNKCVNSNVET
jgi:hypothetical protein